LRAGLRQPDGIHMTAQGHRRVAEQLAAAIR
jgi:acyl-CoA thioesterase-1